MKINFLPKNRRRRRLLVKITKVQEMVIRKKPETERHK